MSLTGSEIGVVYAMKAAGVKSATEQVVGSQRAVQTEVAKTNAALRESNVQSGKAATRMAQSARSQAASAASVAVANERAAARTSLTWAKAAKGAERSGHALTKYLTLPLGLVGVAAVKMGADFEEQMKLIQTQAGGSAKDVEILSKRVLDLGRHTTQGPEELAKALFHLKSVGMDNADAMKALHVASQGATMGIADLEQTTNVLAGAWKTNIKGAGDFKHTMAVLNGIIGSGNLRMDDLVGALSTGVLPVIKKAGLSIQDFGAALASATAQGVPAEQFATRFRTSVLMMINPSSKAETAMEKIGLSGDRLARDLQKPKGLMIALHDIQDHLKGLSKYKQEQTIAAMFGGSKGASTFNVLLNAAKKMPEQYRRIDEAQRNYNKDVAAANAEPINQLRIAWSDLRVELIQLGTQALPWLTKLAHGASDVIGWFDGLSSNTKKWIGILAGVAFVIGPVLLIFSKIVTGVRAIGTALQFVSRQWISTGSASAEAANVMVASAGRARAAAMEAGSSYLGGSRASAFERQIAGGAMQTPMYGFGLSGGATRARGLSRFMSMRRFAGGAGLALGIGGLIGGQMVGGRAGGVLTAAGTGASLGMLAGPEGALAGGIGGAAYKLGSMAPSAFHHGGMAGNIAKQFAENLIPPLRVADVLMAHFGVSIGGASKSSVLMAKTTKLLGDRVKGLNDLLDSSSQATLDNKAAQDKLKGAQLTVTALEKKAAEERKRDGHVSEQTSRKLVEAKAREKQAAVEASAAQKIEAGETSKLSKKLHDTGMAAIYFANAHGNGKSALVEFRKQMLNVAQQATQHNLPLLRKQADAVLELSQKIKGVPPKYVSQMIFNTKGKPQLDSAVAQIQRALQIYRQTGGRISFDIAMSVAHLPSGLRHAAGGRIPGAPVAADNVPALLSPGEFVVTGGGEQILEQLTGMPGVLDWLQHVQPAHFAAGGRVVDGIARVRYFDGPNMVMTKPADSAMLYSGWPMRLGMNQPLPGKGRLAQADVHRPRGSFRIAVTPHMLEQSGGELYLAAQDHEYDHFGHGTYWTAIKALKDSHPRLNIDIPIDLIGARKHFARGGRVVTASDFTGSRGYRGDSLVGNYSYAELSRNWQAPRGWDFHALGGLPHLYPLRITYHGRSVVARKRDVGRGGPGIGGHPRAIDLTMPTAHALGFNGLGLVTLSSAGGGKLGSIGATTARFQQHGFAETPYGAFERGIEAGQNYSYKGILGDVLRGMRVAYGHPRSGGGSGGVSPGSGPAAYRRMVAQANSIASHNYPYALGGGHNSSFSPGYDIRGTGKFGYDCSGAVGSVLHAGGLLSSPRAAQDFVGWGRAGKGNLVTVYAHAGGAFGGHTYMRLGNRYFGTSTNNPGGGANWFSGGARAGFAQRHPRGMRAGGRVGFARGGRVRHLLHEIAIPGLSQADVAAVAHAMRALNHLLVHGTLALADSTARRIKHEIEHLRRHGVTAGERVRLRRLEGALRVADFAAGDILGRRIAMTSFLEQRAQLQEQGLELRQQIAGTFDTAAGGKARAAFMREHILPELQREQRLIDREIREARKHGAGKGKLQQLELELLQKQDDILSLRKAIEDNTKAVGNNTQQLQQQQSGATGFEFGGENWTDLLLSGVGS